MAYKLKNSKYLSLTAAFLNVILTQYAAQLGFKHLCTKIGE